MIGVGAWALTLVIGLGWLWSYEAAPGTPARAPSQWPADSSLRLLPGKLNLVMFAHPRCPCSRASVAELSYIMTRANDRIAAHVVFVRPDGTPEEFTHTSLRNDAALIRGVSVVVDSRGAEASRFGSTTSGDVFLFDEHGTLLFSGGITSSRGHEGENAGRDALLSLISAPVPGAHHTSVYGCPLFDSTSSLRGGNSCPQ